MSEQGNHAYVNGYCCLRFPVINVQKSIDFYCNVLGYELTSADVSFGEAHISLRDGNGPSIFLMETKPEFLTRLRFIFPRSFWVTNRAGHVTMIELATNDLLGLHQRIKQAGDYIDEEPVFTKEFGHFTFYDPDGHYIRVVEERAAEPLG
ncbi:VOC family protein [Paenibacillus sp. TRM 82003]|nr:VOC family protein [Paenibacillus sp. TRM 82003]